MVDKICKICEKDVGCTPSEGATILLCSYCVQTLYNKDRDAAMSEIRTLLKSTKTYNAEKLSIVMRFYGLTQNDIKEDSEDDKNNKFKRIDENFRYKPAATCRFERERA